MDDRRDAQHRLPVLTQDVEADLAFQINVWVIHLQAVIHQSSTHSG
jgi:hypothetical protein